MIIGTCHCGAVRYEYDHVPKWTTSCNCSVCRRLGALWIYAKLPQIKITGSTVAYAWGDRSLAFHSCEICGCTTHWENRKPTGVDDYMAVNLRLADPETVASVPVRHFDGAETWAFLD